MNGTITKRKKELKGPEVALNEHTLGMAQNNKQKISNSKTPGHDGFQGVSK